MARIKSALAELWADPGVEISPVDPWPRVRRFDGAFLPCVAGVPR